MAMTIARRSAGSRITLLSALSLTALPCMTLGLTTAACSSDAEADGGNPDVDPIAWVSPTKEYEIEVGDLVPLTVKVNEPTATGVEFSVDGEVVGRCDTTDGANECRRGPLFRIVTTFRQAGERHLVAKTLGSEARRSSQLDVTVVERRTPGADAGGTSPNRDGGAGGDLDAGLDDEGGADAGVAPGFDGGGDTDAGVDAGPTTPPPDRGFLDPDKPLHNVFGGVSWSVKGQYVEVADALTTQVSQIASCMNTYGASIIKHADANKVSRGSVVATAITESNCTNPAGSSDGLSSGPMQVTGYTCRAIFPGRFGSDGACTNAMYQDPDFSFEAGCRVMGENYAVNIHDHDPPKIAAQYNAGSVKQSSANRWHMVVTGNHIDRFVAAYNAYRSWEELNGIAREALSKQVAGRPVPFFDGEHVRQASELPAVAKEGQVYFVGDWSERDGEFVTYREGRWQLH